MQLVIVESPAKIKSIQKYLGSKYTVAASYGHVADLPKSKLGVDVDHDYQPTYVISNKKAITQLKKLYKQADGLIIATDPDREGEAIGFHVARELGAITPKGNLKKGAQLERISFTSITQDAVKQAISNPRGIDYDLFCAQQARRVLDRLVGYTLSPLLWKKIRYGLSAGRVQSVALRLIVEKEAERDAFVPEEYWHVTAGVSKKQSKSQVSIILDSQEGSAAASKIGDKEIVFTVKKINNKKAQLHHQEVVTQLLTAMQKKRWSIDAIHTKERKRHPKPPFTTSTLQQTASSWLGFSAKKTMTLAQKLYEQGKITYMRTDSTNVSSSAVTEMRKYISSEYGASYLPEKSKHYRTKAKVAQEAHEAIRATKISYTGTTGLPADQAKLYRLIWQRSLASQMNPARVEVGTVTIEHQEVALDAAMLAKLKKEHDDYKHLKVSNTLQMVANGQVMLFDGYLKVYPESFEEQPLPDLKQGEQVWPKTLEGIQKFTQPPGRYTEASLIKVLESYGIGRPSTYVPIISTLTSRKYVGKEGRSFYPTPTGKVIIKLMTDHFKDIVDYQFTAELENDLDEIANGEKDWVKTMKEFYTPFAKQVKQKEKSIDKEAYTVLGDAPKDIVCPDCKAQMKVKLGRYGKFYSCSKWPECKGMRGLDGKDQAQKQKELQQKKQSDQFTALYQPAPKTDDGRDYVLRKGRYGEFWSHPDYPKVKDAKPLEYKPEIKQKIYGKPPVGKNGKTLILRSGRYGEFWAHPDYPKVKEIKKIDKKQVAEKKQELGIPLRG